MLGLRGGGPPVAYLGILQRLGWSRGFAFDGVNPGVVPHGRFGMAAGAARGEAGTNRS